MTSDTEMLHVAGLEVSYPGARSWRGRGEPHRAVQGVTLAVDRGASLGVVGESGSGKSTLALAILRLIDATSGSIRLAGTDITHLSRKQVRPFRRQMQMVFQDASQSLNQRMKAADLLREPLRVHSICAGPTMERRIDELLELVALGPEYRDRYPHQLSGGQRARLAIARALAVEPALIVCDEPTSALDVSVRAQVLALLDRLRAELDLTYVFISHDVGAVWQVSSHVAVMKDGRIVEHGTADDVLGAPRQDYTKALLAAVPRIASADGPSVTAREHATANTQSERTR